MPRKLWAAAAVLALLAVGGIIWAADRGALPSLLTGLYAFPHGDKLGHFLLMGGLSFAVTLAIGAPAGPLLTAALVTLEELSQLAFRTRSFDLLDLLASLLGIAVFGWLAGKATRRRSPARA